MYYFDINLDIGWEEEAIKESAHQFAKEVLRPAAIEMDSMTAQEAVSKESPLWDALKQTYGLGYHKAPFPKAIGGGGLTPCSPIFFLKNWCGAVWGLQGLCF